MEIATDRLAVVEREPGDAAKQRKVREVVRPVCCCRGWIGLDCAAPVLADKETILLVKQLGCGCSQPLAPKPVALCTLTVELHLQTSSLRVDVPSRFLHAQ